ncbi:MAG: polymer-forming cytoskeletal protein [bacterium]
MAKAPTVITATTTVSGRIEGAEDIDVFGAIKGSVTLDGDLYIDEKARVEADLAVNHLVVHGILVGNVTATASVRITESARVIGDITAPRVALEAGARYRGTIDMGEIEGEEAKPASRERDRGRPASPARGVPTSRAATPSRPAPAARPAARPSRDEKPAPARAEQPPARKAEPEPVEPEAVAAATEDEPELPEGAAAKKVAVKKRD